MKIENKRRFLIKRLNGKDARAAIDEEEIVYIGCRIVVKDKTQPVEYYLETGFGDFVVISKKDYEQLRACIEHVDNCEEAKDDQ